jgi:hypothetical protein
MKMDLLTNATVIDDAISFVSEKSKDNEKLKSCSDINNEDNKEESKDQLEEEQEEMTGKRRVTTNTVF